MYKVDVTKTNISSSTNFLIILASFLVSLENCSKIKLLLSTPINLATSVMILASETDSEALPPDKINLPSGN